jgi:hypothetical protein
MSATHPFLTNENMKLLWDVLMENELFQNKSKDFLIKINYLVNQNIHSFFEQEKTHSPHLIDLNKKFITLLLNHIQKILLTEQKVKPFVVKPNLVTSEDIQNHRQTQFERDLSSKQQEFTNAMTLPVPPTPVFQDKIDEPLTELELEIKKTMAQRNYDIEQIQNNIHQIQVDPAWLTSQETSVKKEKLNYPGKTEPKKEETPIKYIKIENKEIDDRFLKKEIVDLNASQKHISWEDEREDERKDEREYKKEEDFLESQLFQKLKKLPPAPDLTERMEKMEGKLEKIEQLLELLINKNEKKVS